MTVCVRSSSVSSARSRWSRGWRSGSWSTSISSSSFGTATQPGWASSHAWGTHTQRSDPAQPPSPGGTPATPEVHTHRGQTRHRHPARVGLQPRLRYTHTEVRPGTVTQPGWASSHAWGTHTQRSDPAQPPSPGGPPATPEVQSLLKVAIHGGGGATRPDLGRAVQFEGHWIARPNPGRQRAGGAAGARAEWGSNRSAESGNRGAGKLW